VNKAFCDTCLTAVPAEPVERDGRIFLQKHCPKCGTKETYISSDAARYFSKRKLDVEFDYRSCKAECQSCTHGQQLRFAFVNVTNRCNMNCPICFDNVPGLGFSFEPPLEYFDKLFADIAQLNPSPTICIFGGEPTVREDLFDIIALTKKHGLRARVYTNGMKLADEEYCRKLLATRTQVYLSYDGSNPEMYEKLRGSAKFLELKQKGVDNMLKQGIKRGKLALVWVLSHGLNDQSIPELLEFCHERRETITDVYLTTLCHAWDTTKWAFTPDRITTEDVERLTEKAFPGYKINFLPLGLMTQLTALNEVIARKTTRPSYGAHPNCESVYYALSDGEKYVPIEHYLKGTTVDLAEGMLNLSARVGARRERWKAGVLGRVLGAVRLRNFVQKVIAITATATFITSRIRLFRLVEGRGPAKLWHLLMLGAKLAFRRPIRPALQRHTRVKGHLMVAILPLEDTQVLETNRLERCPTAQAYLDPKTQTARFVPLCAWKLHNKKVLREIADYYAESQVSKSG